jgi:PAS domain S-box-containing protein
MTKHGLGIALIGKDGRYKYVNPAFTRIFGYILDDVSTGRDRFSAAFPDINMRQAIIRTWLEDQRQIAIGQARPRIYSVVRKDGSTKEIFFRPVTMEDHDQFVLYEDITEKIKMEQQLQQAHKYEDIGTLAGGIAHDFNNLLMGIQGRSSLLAAELDATHEYMEHIDPIGAYIRSATGLTRQLLGFARGGKYEVKPMDLNTLVDSSATMFGRTRKEIQISISFGPPSLVVEADRSQIEQVLLNMYVNAWQAMPEGGQLVLETSVASLEEAHCQPYGLPAGRYAKVSISDSGIGMDLTVQQRVFDPFFTTKDKSRGTGLGLASAFLQHEANAIDLVILDMIMPEMDGGKTFERIRGLCPDLPVILSIGYALSGQATEIMNKGCNGFIQKPFNLSELSQKVRNILDTEQEADNS